nr:rhomboid family intramembrane serine protease [Anaerolineae bacterium]
MHPLEQPPSPVQGRPPTMAQAPALRVELPGGKPILTYALLAINILVFIADFILVSSGLGYNGVGPLTIYGAKVNEAIIAGQYWRMVTPLFLHGGILHLGFNSYFLFMVGRRIERAYGSLRFGLIYFISGMSGTLVSFAFSTHSSIGASSALFGIIGAWIPLLYHNRNVLLNTSRQMRSIIQVIAINLLIGLTPGIDNWAHLGGLVGGLAFTWFTAPRYRLQVLSDGRPAVQDWSSSAQAVALASIACVIIGALMVATILFRA